MILNIPPFFVSEYKPKFTSFFIFLVAKMYTVPSPYFTWEGTQPERTTLKISSHNLRMPRRLKQIVWMFFWNIPWSTSTTTCENYKNVAQVFYSFRLFYWRDTSFGSGNICLTSSEHSSSSHFIPIINPTHKNNLHFLQSLCISSGIYYSSKHFHERYRQTFSNDNSITEFAVKTLYNENKFFRFTPLYYINFIHIVHVYNILIFVSGIWDLF